MPRSQKFTILGYVAAVGAIILASPTLAGSGGGGLPWEAPLQQIQESITGPGAGYITTSRPETSLG